MPRYTVKDPISGKTVVLTGDSPPTEAELNQIFAELARPSKPASTEDSMPAKPAGSGVVSNFLQRVLPSTTASDYIEGPLHVAAHPIDSLGLLLDAMKNAHATQFRKFGDDVHGIVNEPTLAGKAAAQGKAVGHLAAGLIPLVGPAAADIGEQIGNGDTSGGIGGMLGLLAGVLAPKGAQAVVERARIPGVGATKNPQQAAAVALADREGIPVDAATASGRPWMRQVQKRIGDSMGGSAPAEKFRANQDAGLTATGRKLAAQADPSGPTSPELAGKALRDDVMNVVKQEHGTADAAYGRLRAIEAKNPIAVDLTRVKSALEPVYRTLAVGADIAPLQGAKASAVRALARILEGPDIAGASEVDSALSDLKSLARGAEIPELRSVGQGVAAKAVQEVEAALQKAVTAAGPDAVKALSEGRAATIAKAGASDVLDALRTEPVQVFRQATYARDAGIQQLRDVAKLAPDGLRKVGRAYLDDLIDTATNDGKFEHAQKLSAEWEKLGPETKKLMFKDPAYIRDLDSFFRLAKSIGENPNPSGTAVTWNATNVSTYVPFKLTAKMLYSSGGIKRVINGMRLLPSKARTAGTAPAAGVSAPRAGAPGNMSAPTGTSPAVPFARDQRQSEDD